VPADAPRFDAQPDPPPGGDADLPAPTGQLGVAGTEGAGTPEADNMGQADSEADEAVPDRYGLIGTNAAMPAEGPTEGPDDEPEEESEFEPANELERTLARCVFSGARGSLLRALARGILVALADTPPEYGLSSAQAGGVQVPCIADTEGRHALLYTSYEQLVLANKLPGDSAARWYELSVAELFGRWPKDVDIWLNAGGQLGFPLDPVDIATIGDIAAGLEVDEAYEIGPDDEFSDFPGPSIPDQVDCAIVLSLFDLPEVLEVVRAFRRLEEPRGRTWRIVLVLVDREVHGEALAQQVVEAINEASDECCEVHVAEVADDDVYEAIEHLLHIGVPLWRREGFQVPDSLEGLADLDLTALETGAAVPDTPEALGRDLEPGGAPELGPPELDLPDLDLPDLDLPDLDLPPDDPDAPTRSA
jgi:hypothetical protein